MNVKRRIHDGIAGAIVATGVVAGYFSHSLWLLVPALLGLTLL
jgi:hypothetical protein